MVSKAMLVLIVGLLPMANASLLVGSGNDVGIDPALELAEETRTLVDTVADETVAEATEAAERVVEAVDETLDCKLLVRVPITRHYGDFGETEVREHLFRTLRHFITYEYEEVTPELGLDILGNPISGPTVSVPVEVDRETVHYIVKQTWEYTDVEWVESKTTDFYLPVTSAPLFTGKGSIENVCEDVTVVPSIPTFGKEGHDVVHWHFGYNDHHHGYEYRHWGSYEVTVRQATDRDHGVLPHRMLVPHHVTEATEAELDNTHKDYEPRSSKSTSAGGAEGVSASGMAAGAGGGLAALGLLGAGLAFLRKRK